MRSQNRRKGFTLVELLVVVLIVLLCAAVALPQILPALNQRQTIEAARIVQAALAGARDAAIRANAPRGIRLMPDPTLTTWTPTNPNGVVAYNRFQQLQMAPDYAEGKVSIGPMLNTTSTTFPPLYPNKNGGVYPYPEPNSGTQQVLMIEESPFIGGFTVGTTAIPNSPTSWYWNIRIGDRIRINDAGRYYTVVGPCTVNPITAATLGQNPELFVNVGLPGTVSPLTRTYYADSTSGTITTTTSPEFLFVVNGQDDNGNGYVDEGFNGFDENIDFELANSAPHVADEVLPVTPAPGFDEWEQEKWLGAASGAILLDTGAGTHSPSAAWVSASAATTLHDLPYSIARRPVPVEGARETTLPGGVVVDATTWNTTMERSRLPIDPNSLFADLLVNADGQVVPQTIYSTPVSFNEPFFHFWITDREDVLDPIDQTANGVKYLLPMIPGALNYPNASDTSNRALKGDRRLVSVFTKSGLVTTDTAENFNGNDVNAPFYDAQLGANAAK